MPERLTASARIAPPEAAGETLVIEGSVNGADGAPRAGIVVYAYQTDASGIYPRHPRGIRHGRLRGWAKTDAEGRYRFDTIRPGGYPDSGIPQHVHFHVVEPGRCTYWIGDLLFDDDPRLTPRERARAVDGRGGSGLASPARDADGTWRVRRDIRLGLGIPGYERCGG
jgi:protocatechuate 3,4-dioxygenase beta subunit